GTGMGPPNTVTVCTSSNSTWMPKVTARLAIAPTTAAVTVDNDAASVRFPRSRSTYGAPRKIQRKHGANVAHVVTVAPMIPATVGDSVPGCWYAPRKPTNSVTMISGPGVLSASPRPAIIWPGSSQPYCSTAAWLMYA